MHSRRVPGFSQQQYRLHRVSLSRARVPSLTCLVVETVAVVVVETGDSKGTGCRACLVESQERVGITPD